MTFTYFYIQANGSVYIEGVDDGFYMTMSGTINFTNNYMILEETWTRVRGTQW